MSMTLVGESISCGAVSFGAVHEPARDAGVEKVCVVLRSGDGTPATALEVAVARCAEPFLSMVTWPSWPNVRGRLSTGMFARGGVCGKTPVELADGLLRLSVSDNGVTRVRAIFGPGPEADDRVPVG